MKKEMRLVQCTVNGRPVAEYVDVREFFWICYEIVLDLPL